MQTKRQTSFYRKRQIFFYAHYVYVHYVITNDTDNDDDDHHHHDVKNKEDSDNSLFFFCCFLRSGLQLFLANACEPNYDTIDTIISFQELNEKLLML